MCYLEALLNTCHVTVPASCIAQALHIFCASIASHEDGCAAQRILYNPAQTITLMPAQEQGLSPAAQQALGEEGSKNDREQPVEGPAEKGKEEQTDILDQLMLDGAVQDPQPGGIDALSADQPAGESACSHVSKPAHLSSRVSYFLYCDSTGKADVSMLLLCMTAPA